jgi:hypothetical protein
VRNIPIVFRIQTCTSPNANSTFSRSMLVFFLIEQQWAVVFYGDKQKR